jgi:hypothetical protein
MICRDGPASSIPPMICTEEGVRWLSVWRERTMLLRAAGMGSRDRPSPASSRSMRSRASVCPAARVIWSQSAVYGNQKSSESG